ncbi:MAG: hypothetical protein GY757_47465 [bacterium]|nr:hypothetical protein [bacterium]
MNDVAQDESKQLLDEFCRETEESLDSLDSHILIIKSFVFDQKFEMETYINFCRGLHVDEYLENLRAVNRVVHTIKGVSSFMELPKINIYCHSVEELTLNLSKGTIFLSQRACNILEKLPVILNRFLETIKSNYNDEAVSIDKDVQEIRNATKELFDRMDGKVIHLESIRGKDIGRVRDYRKELKVSINLTTYDDIIHEYQAFTQDALNSMQESSVNFETFQGIKRAMQQHLDRLILAARGKIILSRYPRLVSDLANSLDKKINFIIEGNEAFARPETWDRVHNALVHLVRNSVDHGIETPNERIRMKKGSIGNMRLMVSEDFRNIYVALEDDGAGIDEHKVAKLALDRKVVTQKELDSMDKNAKQRLIFRPGFSTRDDVSDVSGRGVGMDAVLKEIEINLNGKVTLHSQKNVGTSFILEIPKTETLSECIRFGNDHYQYAVPVVPDIQYIECNPKYLNYVMGKAPLYTEGNLEVPLLNVFPFLHPGEFTDLSMDYLPIIKIGEKHSNFGLVVPSVLGQERIKIDRRKIVKGIVQDSGLVFGYGLTDPITVVLDLDYLHRMIDTVQPPVGT